MDIKILKDLFQVTIDRGNLSNRHNQVIHKRIMVDLGLLKSGKVELRSTIDQGNLRTTSWAILQKVDPHREETSSRRKCAFRMYGELIHDGTGKTRRSGSPRTGLFRKFRHGQ